MHSTARFLAALCPLILAGIVGARPAGAESPPTICTGNLTISTTSSGTVTQSGSLTFYRNSGVAGSYTSGPLSGDTFTGSQNIVVNSTTGQSALAGSYTVAGTNGSIVLGYVGYVNLNTGKATGLFRSLAGTGQLESFHWTGTIAAQLVSLSPPTFLSTDTGSCGWRD